MNIKEHVRDIPDFPKEGIVFKDITPLLANPDAFRDTIDTMAELAESMGAETIIGIESRGFIFGGAIAHRLGLGFIPVRKPGKLPYKTIRESYSLEYGTDSLEIHEDSLKAGDNVVIIDDLLATGGTARAAARLVESLNARVAGILFLVELQFLKGRDQLTPYRVESLAVYSGE